MLFWSGILFKCTWSGESRFPFFMRKSHVVIYSSTFLIIQVHARQEQSGDTRRRVCVAKSQLFITPFVCIQSYTCLHHLYTGVGNHMLLLSPRNLSTPSYVPNMMAALGTTRNM